MFETKCLEQSETRAFGPQGLLEYTLANFTVNLYLKTQKTFLKMLKLSIEMRTKYALVYHIKSHFTLPNTVQ